MLKQRKRCVLFFLAEEHLRHILVALDNLFEYPPNGLPVPVKFNEQGNPIVSRLNEEMCRQIAQAGNGAYIYVDNSSSAQKELSTYVDKLAKAKLESQVYSEFDEQYQGFLILALVFLFLDLCLLERRNHLLQNFHLFRRKENN